MTLFLLNLRNNYIVRFLLFPYIKLKKRLALRKYQKSEDSEYIKGLKNKYDGSRCFIIGNGPSLSKEDLDLLINEKTFAFNRIYDMYPYTEWRPDFYMMVDKNLLNILKKDIKSLSDSDIFINDKKMVEKFRKLVNIHQIVLSGEFFIKKEKMIINKVNEDVFLNFSVTHTVVLSAMEFAFFMGFKEIYLLGVDCNFSCTIDMEGNKKIDDEVISHFEAMKDKNKYPAYKEAMIICFQKFKDYADAHDIKIYNATKGGKLEVFPRVKLDTVLSKSCEDGLKNEN